MPLFGRSKEMPSEKIENVIGPTANFNGHFKAEGGIRIDGLFEGTIETAGNVIVGEEARVMADITARNVSVAGVVKGNVNATGRLEILSTGQVRGDIAVPSFLIDEGGIFRGQSVMQGAGEPLLFEEAKGGGEKPEAGEVESAAEEQT
jgi:cytoskeletal protein CcmA (bactofilin family)